MAINGENGSANNVFAMINLQQYEHDHEHCPGVIKDFTCTAIRLPVRRFRRYRFALLRFPEEKA
ncbi:hypothetical protein [Actinoallomurus sp. CA-150999]|uniref:hypothetical protein n=1 Tax=Actinoallomurus sp. CA-150999 TaxID=3239887 RepID=UPI003D8DE8B5